MNNIKKDKLWVYSEFFFPDETATSYIMTTVCNKLTEKYDVEVICGESVLQKPNEQELYLKLNPAVKLRRIKTFQVDKNKNWSRIINFLALSFTFFCHLLFKTKKGDKVFTVTNPATFVVLASFATVIKKSKITILVHDVFPENTVAGGYIKDKSNFKYRFIEYIFNKAYSKFEKIIVLGRDMKNVFEKKLFNYNQKPNIQIIENWADTENITPSNKINLDNRIIIQYAGNIGSVQGLDYLFKVIKDVKNDEIFFDFIGNGKLKSSLVKYSKKNGMKNVSFKESFSRDLQNDMLNNCNLAIVSLSKGMYGLGVPSKTYNILAAGKPILYIGDKNSEIALLIEEYNIGYYFQHENKADLLSFLNDLKVNKYESELLLKGKNARELAETLFAENIILDKFKSIV
ncbi:MAG: hypothetical protein BGO86_12120 [Chryseobacterium sp. 36-9]|uniref:Glycosyltransferase involved in cell wall bisynthesis n=1 Tax=Epilithonimonas pallida TaxID=373671 RepID=A0ABY1R5N4_9FLAO|nr:glycosyltransferase family 4 protein [Epilithonimonas pallida]OJX29628.1 MAG: hypothetical protein BGO86_12120 [Chryseobacterium sp. 36-9]SMP94808.1 Glycosyltransferase involved in cell wall bisynthesis [Epilithonimonas pallida]